MCNQNDDEDDDDPRFLYYEPMIGPYEDDGDPFDPVIGDYLAEEEGKNAAT